MRRCGLTESGRWIVEISRYGASTPVSAPAASDVKDTSNRYYEKQSR
jgi:hypothetical protein